MSLLDSGPETLTIYPSRWDEDPDGNWLWRGWAPGDPTYEIRGAQVEPQSSQAAAYASSSSGGNGQIITETFTVRFKTLPEGAKCRWDEVVWRGESWVTDGAPVHYGRSPATAHYVVLLVRAGRENLHGHRV